MDVGIATAFLDETKGGIWTYTTNLVQGLVSISSGVDYFIVDRQERHMFSERVNQLIIPFQERRFAKFIWPNVALPRALKQHRLDVLHITYPYGTLTNKWSKNIITIHDLSPILFPETHTRMNILHHRLVLPHILKRADRIITVSNSSKESIVKYYHIPPDKVRAIPLGVSPNFKPVLGNESQTKALIPRPYILNVGVIEPRKNLNTLLRSFQLVKKKGFPHKLVLCGPRGWKCSDVDALLNHLGLQEHVIFLGFIPPQALPKLYSSADLFVYPSLYEGFGLPVLEAMACGTPLIASNSSSLPEVVGNAGLLVKPNDSHELAEAMIQVLSHRSLSLELTAKGLQRSKLFSWEQTAKETLKVYREVCR
jgi:glycosyltransferase involved in cell wall biosynthesis